MERKDFIRLSYDPVEEKQSPEDLQEMMRLASERLFKIINPQNE